MTTHDITRTPTELLRRARLTLLIVAIVVPIVLTAIAAGIILSWLPALPHQVVTHWGVDGADGFGPPIVYLWLLVGIGLVLPILMAVLTLASVGTHWGGAARMMGALSAGLAAFAAVMCVTSLAIQRGAQEAAEAPNAGMTIALSFSVLIVVGGAAWAAQPRVAPEQGRTLAARHAVHVAEGERVIWLGMATMPRVALVVLVGIPLGLAALAAYMLSAGVSGGWIVLLALVVIVAAVSSSAAFRVRVTPEGFAARSLLGWPRITIPLAEIESVRAVDVSPFGEFGGWGWRIALDGRTGIVMRSGAAIEVSRRNRKPFLVTIDGAAEAAALMQAYLDRAARST